MTAVQGHLIDSYQQRGAKQGEIIHRQRFGPRGSEPYEMAKSLSQVSNIGPSIYLFASKPGMQTVPRHIAAIPLNSYLFFLKQMQLIS